MNAIQRFFFNLFLFCFGLGLFLFVKLDSYASNAITIEWWTGVFGESNGSSKSQFIFSPRQGSRYGAYTYFNSEYHGTSLGSMYIYSNDGEPITGTLYTWSYNQNGVQTSYNGGVEYSYYPQFIQNGIYEVSYLVNNSFFCSSFLSSDRNDVFAYVKDGVLPEIPYDDTLKLDSFKVTSWSIGNLQALFKSKFDVTWSDSRISFVQVRIKGTANEVTYESSSSPFKVNFQASQFVFQKGDVIHLVATPYKADGSYGESLYYSVTYSDNIPFSNNYRKMVNNNTNDNTLNIPYTGTSGNDTVILPVDGVTTNVMYKVNYNPVTNEYNNQNIYEIYYSPVVIYPDNTSDQEVDDTQDEIINNYNTTNYYETTKNINIDFDINFDDVSGSDIKQGFDDFGNFSNGFGSLLGKISSWILALFPFLSPAVASSIVVCGGFIILLAIIAFVLKIAGVIADLIPL